MNPLAKRPTLPIEDKDVFLWKNRPFKGAPISLHSTTPEVEYVHAVLAHSKM